MDQMLKERDRLLQRTARLYGLSFTVVSALCVAVPGAVSGTTYAVIVPLYLLLVGGQYLFGRSRSIAWIALIVLSGLGIIVAITTLGADSTTPASLSAITQLAAASLASIAITLTTTVVRRIVLAASFLAVSVTAVVLTEPWNT